MFLVLSTRALHGPVEMTSQIRGSLWSRRHRSPDPLRSYPQNPQIHSQESTSFLDLRWEEKLITWNSDEIQYNAIFIYILLIKLPIFRRDMLESPFFERTSISWTFEEINRLSAI